MRKLLQSNSITGSGLFRSMFEKHISITVNNRIGFKISDIGRKRDIDQYEVPLTGFEQYWISPSNINYMTGRDWKPWNNRKQLFGAVKSGDWDRRAPPIPQSDPLHTHYPRNFNEWLRYVAIKKYVRGKTWSDTEYYKFRIRQGWEDQDLINELEHIENLYRSMSEYGYLTQRELGNYPNDKRSRLGNEIIVDISRDGEFLHVDGHHRLEVAKVLDIDAVPVVVLVRHKKWVDKLEKITMSAKIQGITASHPDIQQCRNRCCFGSATRYLSSIPPKKSW